MNTLLFSTQIGSAKAACFRQADSKSTIQHINKIQLIAKLLGKPVEQLILTHDANGKPILYVNGCEVSISISYTHTYMAVIVSPTSPVGIDIECMNPELPLLDMAREFFHPSEYNKILTTTCAEERQRLFFGLWTCKEAILKLSGTGISNGMDQTNLSAYLGDISDRFYNDMVLSFSVGPNTIWSLCVDSLIIAMVVCSLEIVPKITRKSG